MKKIQHHLVICLLLFLSTTTSLQPQVAPATQGTQDGIQSARIDAITFLYDNFSVIQQANPSQTPDATWWTYNAARDPDPSTGQMSYPYSGSNTDQNYIGAYNAAYPNAYSNELTLTIQARAQRDANEDFANGLPKDPSPYEMSEPTYDNIYIPAYGQAYDAAVSGAAASTGPADAAAGATAGALAGAAAATAATPGSSTSAYDATKSAAYNNGYNNSGGYIPAYAAAFTSATNGKTDATTYKNQSSDSSSAYTNAYNNFYNKANAANQGGIDGKNVGTTAASTTPQGASQSNGIIGKTTEYNIGYNGVAGYISSYATAFTAKAGGMTYGTGGTGTTPPVVTPPVVNPPVVTPPDIFNPPVTISGNPPVMPQIPGAGTGTGTGTGTNPPPPPPAPTTTNPLLNTVLTEATTLTSTFPAGITFTHLSTPAKTLISSLKADLVTINALTPTTLQLAQVTALTNKFAGYVTQATKLKLATPIQTATKNLSTALMALEKSLQPTTPTPPVTPTPKPAPKPAPKPGTKPTKPKQKK